MSVIDIKAKVDCDECGAVFKVYLDPSHELAKSWSLWDEVENTVRSGTESSYGPLKSTSVQEGKMLCPACTVAADALHEEEDE